MLVIWIKIALINWSSPKTGNGCVIHLMQPLPVFETLCRHFPSYFINQTIILFSHLKLYMWSGIRFYCFVLPPNLLVYYFGMVFVFHEELPYMLRPYLKSRCQSVTNTFFWPNTNTEYYSVFRNHRISNTIWYWENPNTEYRILFGIKKIRIPNTNSTIRSNYSNTEY